MNYVHSHSEISSLRMKFVNQALELHENYYYRPIFADFRGGFDLITL